jgi:putative glutamine amidotransferase
VAARAPDGVLEAFEDPETDFFIGVQWHPERAPFSRETQRLFAALVEAAARGAR